MRVEHKGKEFEVNNWVVSDFIANEVIPVVGHHPFPLPELHLMASSVTHFNPSHIFEWGTYRGKSARIFSEVLEHFKIPAHIFSIDLPDDVPHDEHPGEMRGAFARGCKNVTFIQGDGLMDSLKLVKEHNPSKALFFIDGDHSYESVKYEFGTLIKRVPNAVFLLHDTFYQTKESGYNVGPHKAMNEVLAGVKNKYKVLSTNTGLPGMSLVYSA